MATSKKSTPKKKAAPAKKGKTAKGKNSSVANKNKNQNQERRNPLFMLIILVLITVIVLLINRFTENRSNRVERNTNISKTSTIPKERKEEKRVETIEPQKEVAADKVKENVTNEKTRNVRIYFIKLNNSTEKMYLTSVQRSVGSGTALNNTLNQLIKGPTKNEKNRGYLTAVPGNLRIRNIRIRNRTAVIDFNGALETGANGNILLSRLDQIIYTATQFPDVSNIEIRVNGVRKRTLGSDGLSISGPLQRR